MIEVLNKGWIANDSISPGHTDHPIANDSTSTGPCIKSIALNISFFAINIFFSLFFVAYLDIITDYKLSVSAKLPASFFTI
jgi:hypothetical protein